MKNYDQVIEINNMIDAFDLYLVPVANPDGYEFSMTKVSRESGFNFISQKI